MKRGLLLTCVLLALGASEAQAHTTIIEPIESHHPYQQWVDEAFVPTPDRTITLLETSAPCGSALAYGCTDGEVIQVAVEDDEDKLLFLHELGHGWDRWTMTEHQRERFLHLIRQSAIPWNGYWAPGGFTPLPPMEWFAETYALCAIRQRFPLHTEYNIGAADGILGAPAMRRICGMIRG